MQLKEGVFRCIMQLYDCLLTEVHERCKKGLSLAKRLNSSLAFFCYDLLSVIEPRQVFELVGFFFAVIYTIKHIKPSLVSTTIGIGYTNHYSPFCSVKGPV